MVIVTGLGIGHETEARRLGTTRKVDDHSGHLNLACIEEWNSFNLEFEEEDY